ncbi:hypothetical protein [Paracoccus yeei]|uniref:hypothetical protein n=1 Tax=Paracoccus yeei TaxID=147645 RepID=UPI00174B74AC|nr:hypothetical protein [Paracoccus yeei]
MPEFILEGRDHAARAESPFVLGFIEAMFFTECSPAYMSDEWVSDECREAQEQGQADGTLPGDVGYCDLHPESLARIRAFCEAFQRENAALLAQAYARPDYDETQAGRDLWYTSQGHGVGFWDRAALDAEGLGDKLSDAARYHDANTWFAGHVTYGDAPFVHVEI